MSSDQVLASVFPKDYHEDLAIVAEWLHLDEHAPHFDKFGSVLVDGESLSVLTRTYFNVSTRREHSPEGGDESRFHISDDRSSLLASPPRQREMMACIQSRDSSGYHRMEYAGIVSQGNYPWSIPFYFQLATDYIVPIAERVYVRLPTLRASRRIQIAKFAEANPLWIDLLARRVVTHWNWHRCCWFRDACGTPHYANLYDYPAYKTLLEFGLWPRKLAYRRLRKKNSD